jgi:hypothetical protein
VTSVSPPPAAPSPFTATARPATSPARRTGFGGLLLAEWTKIRSVRSTPWTLVIFAVVSLGLTGLLTWLTLRALNDGRNGARGSGILTDPVGFILGTGLGLGQLAICVLGALVITGEYSSGTIRASLLAIPHRYPMMLAKALVFAVLVFIVGEIVAFCSFFIGAVLVNGQTFTLTCTISGHASTAHRTLSVSLSQPGVLRAVFGAGLYLTVLGPVRPWPLAAWSGIPRSPCRGAGPSCRRSRSAARPRRPAAGQLGRPRPRLPADGGGAAHHPGQTLGRPALVGVAGIRRVLRLDRAAPGRGDLPAPKAGRLTSRRRRGRAVASGRRPGPVTA